MPTVLAGPAIAEAITYRRLTVETRVPFQASPCGIDGRQSGTGTALSTSVFPCQYHSIPSHALVTDAI
jgi:hypothetical protein